MRRLGHKNESHQAFSDATFLTRLHPKVWGGYVGGLMQRVEHIKAISAYEKAIFLEADELLIQGLGKIYAFNISLKYCLDSVDFPAKY